MRRFASGDRVVLATHNAGKIAELRPALEAAGLNVTNAGSLGLPAPDETEDDFFRNALLKARAAARASGLPALADDSGFAVAALGGAPGALSARWAADGYPAAMHRVRSEAASDTERQACLTCALAVAWPDDHVALFEGRVDGVWTWPPRGASGFGYDPMFVPEGCQRTFGEMNGKEKAALSHRGRAFALFARACLP